VSKGQLSLPESPARYLVIGKRCAVCRKGADVTFFVFDERDRSIEECEAQMSFLVVSS
jgi:hypothetical protein